MEDGLTLKVLALSSPSTISSIVNVIPSGILAHLGYVVLRRYASLKTIKGGFGAFLGLLGWSRRIDRSLSFLNQF